MQETIFENNDVKDEVKIVQTDIDSKDGQNKFLPIWIWARKS